MNSLHEKGAHPPYLWTEKGKGWGGVEKAESGINKPKSQMKGSGGGRNFGGKKINKLMSRKENGR